MTTEEGSSANAFPGPRNGAQVKCLAIMRKGQPLQESRILRRLPKPDDVGIEIMYCGICHSDLHGMDDDWGNSIYPLVPGHEIVGIVRLLGNAVSNFYIGEPVGVGYFCDCCRKCRPCLVGQPQYCDNGIITTFNSKYARDDDFQTFGGFSTFIAVDKRFVFSLPTNLSMPSMAPLLCAGVTVYSPMRYCNVGPNCHVGVVGIGGLGHLAIKIARALGARVTAISHTAEKKDEARKLGAHDFILLNDAQAMSAAGNTLNLILDTASTKHDLRPLMELLRMNGRIALIGAVTAPYEISAIPMIMHRRGVFATCTGSPQDVREMLHLCSMHNIAANVELVSVDDLDNALQRLRRNDVRFRLVLDVRTLKDGFKEWLDKRKKDEERDQHDENQSDR